MSNYPFIERLGLMTEVVFADAIPRNIKDNWDVVRADKLEKLLSSAPVVEAWGGRVAWYDPKLKAALASHTALLVGIQPIRKETAEDLLREFVKEYSDGGGTSILRNISARARKLLEGK